MPKPAKRFPAPHLPPDPLYTALVADRLPEVEPLTIPTWAWEGFLQCVWPGYGAGAPRERRRLGVYVAMVSAELDKLERAQPSLFEPRMDKARLFERMLQEHVSKRQPRCPTDVLLSHAGLLQQALPQGLRGRKACAQWVQENLDRVLPTLRRIPCNCAQRDQPPTEPGPLKRLKNDWLFPHKRDQGVPTSTTLQYSILGYYHDLEPETVRRRLVGSDKKRKG